LNSKVSRGITRLRCGALVIQSLFSLQVKEFLEIGQHLARLWARVSYILTHGNTVIEHIVY